VLSHFAAGSDSVAVLPSDTRARNFVPNISHCPVCRNAVSRHQRRLNKIRNDPSDPSTPHRSTNAEKYRQPGIRNLISQALKTGRSGLPKTEAFRPSWGALWRYERWCWRRCRQFVLLGRTACCAKPRDVFVHFRFLFQMLKCFAQYARCGLILWHHQPVVHPLSFATRGDNSRAAKIGKVPRHFGLADIQNFDNVADADLAIGY
jgi:hypothetical protein